MKLPYYVVPNLEHTSFKVLCAPHVVAAELKLEEAKALAAALNKEAK